MRWWPLLLVMSCAAAPPGPSLASIEPSAVDAQSGGAVTLHGAQWLPPMRFNFDQPDASQLEPATVSAFLIGDGGVRVELLAVTWVDATQVTAQVPPLDLGVYDVHLIEPRGQELVLSQALIADNCFGGVCADAGVCTALNYRDFDLDGYGTGSPVNRCGAGYASRAGDCDDFDNLTNPGATEVCNGIDDDCDGVVDLPSCTAWSLAADGGDDLLFASAWASDGVWLASSTHVFEGAAGSLTQLSAACLPGITAIAAQNTGALELSSPDALQRVEPPGSCDTTRAVDGGVVSLMSFGARFVGVTARGDIWRWTAGEQPVVTSSTLPASATVTAAHGISETQLIAVGMQGSQPRAWFLSAAGTWSRADGLPHSADRLTAVWMLSPTDAVLVGDNGTLVLHYVYGWFDGRSDSVTDDFTAVRAFSLSRIYVTTAGGRVRQRAGGTWRTVFTAPTPLNDISGVAEDALWAVGNGGVVVRGSR